MKLEIRAEHSLSSQERVYLEGWAGQIFAGQDEGYLWAAADQHVFIWEGQELACHVEMIERTITAGEALLHVGGIGGVATWPTWRKHGLATQAMRVAMRFLDETLDVEFGLLICSPEWVPFYQRLGWQAVDGPLVFDQPGGKVQLTGEVMIRAFRGRPWPSGVIDMRGLPW